jgi:hypothetical protein
VVVYTRVIAPVCININDGQPIKIQMKRHDCKIEKHIKKWTPKGSLSKFIP